MVRWVRAGGAVLSTSTTLFVLLAFGGCDLELKPFVEPNEGGVIVRSDAGGGVSDSGDPEPVDSGGVTDSNVPDTAKPDVIVPGVKRVFVTNQTFTGALNGLAGADQRCKAAADAAALRGNFIAWLSINNQGAAVRFADVGPWVLLDNRTQVATNKAQLTTGNLTNPIRLDERGQPVILNVSVWTGTRATGEPAQTCQNFNGIQVGNQTGTVGRLDQKNDQWTQAGQAECNEQLHLYCFEQ